MITFPKPTGEIGRLVKVLVFDGGRVIAGTCMHDVSIDEYCRQCAEMNCAETSKTMRNASLPSPECFPPGMPRPCRCFQCNVNTIDPATGLSVTSMYMTLCRECGNKRCPHATDHRHACTQSNEPGQAGSRYA